MELLKWTDRTFPLGHPVGVLPAIIERLRGTPARIEELIASVPPEALTARLNGKWSMQEHIGHLLDLDPLHEGRVDDFLARAPMLRAADMTNRKTEDARHNEQPIATLLAAFRAARQQLINRIECLDPAIHDVIALHPRLKKEMRVVDMAYFVAEHDDYHLARMRECLRAMQ